LKKVFTHIMRKQNRNGEGECYQVSEKVRAAYDGRNKNLLSLQIAGQLTVGDKNYTLCLQGYHFSNSRDYLGVTNQELIDAGPHKVVSTSAQGVLEKFLRNNQNLKSSVQGRLDYV